MPPNECRRCRRKETAEPAAKRDSEYTDYRCNIEAAPNLLTAILDRQQRERNISDEILAGPSG
jgi:hypothetical protein